MKKYVFAVVMCLMLVFTVSKAYSEDLYHGLYVEPKFLFDVVSADYFGRDGNNGEGVMRTTSGVGGALSVGYDFKPSFDLPIRAELEYGIRTNAEFSYKDHEAKVNTPMNVFANFYYDIPVGVERLTPYIGGGLGVGILNDNANFAWNLGGGVSFDVVENVKLSLGYRYVSLGRFEDNNSHGLYSTHELYTSVRYTF